MKIIHLSDTHGFFPDIPECDLVIHSGDFFTNCVGDNPSIQKEFQKDWLASRINTIVNWIGPRPFFFCSGNHDYIDSHFQRMLNENGAPKARCLNDKLYSWEGLTFYGFPYINVTGGDWNFELSPEKMTRMVSHLKNQISSLDKPLDFFIAHSPPKGILDSYRGISYGVVDFSDWIRDDFESYPSYSLFGHIHSAHGKKILTDPISKTTKSFINSATTISIIEV